MTESYDWDNPVDDMEAMIRAAGEYVRASDDLRPRVLEAARMQHGEQRAKRLIRHATICVLLLAFCHVAEWRGLTERPSQTNGMLAAVGFHEPFSPTPSAMIRSGDGDWRMIDAFTKLRRQQARVLRLEI